MNWNSLPCERERESGGRDTFQTGTSPSHEQEPTRYDS